jgi:pimeloyl-ACP methyl ester carboxylesterase
LFFFQTSFIYYPDQQVFGNCPKLPEGTKAVTYGTEDTRAYYGGEGETLVVVYHGNAGSACDRSWLATSLFIPAATSFLLVEYTGYSNDSKEPSAEAILRNVRDTIEYVGVLKYEKVIVMGQSLGAAAATYHAANADNVDGLFLSTPFISLAQVAKEQYPFYPIDLLLRERLPTAEYLKEVEVPLVIAHGTNDNIAPPHHAEYLFELSPSKEKELLTVEGVGHNSLYNSLKWQQAVREFISK